MEKPRLNVPQTVRGRRSQTRLGGGNTGLLPGMARLPSRQDSMLHPAPEA